MHRNYLYLLFLLVCTNLFAQTQQGYVRTIGRSGKPGQPVSGVMIKVDGPYNMAISAADGKFAILMDGKKNGEAYRFASIKKSNYELLDNAMIGRSLGFSTTVPVDIVLVNLAQKEAEKAALVERYQAQAMAMYEKQIAELEAKNLSSQENNKERIKLDNNFEKILSQIEAQAEYYATQDYDQMDSLNQVIMHHIEMGEFDEAEQLIKSKGGIEERLQQLQQDKDEAQQTQELAQKTQQLATKQAERVQSNQANLEQDLLNLFEIAQSSYQNDTAYYYIQKLLELAPENSKYLKRAGFFLYSIKCQYAQALEYYQKALEIDRKSLGEEHVYVAMSYNYMGMVYTQFCQYDTALEYFQKALDIRLKVLGEEHMDVAILYNNIGVVYEHLTQYDKALAYFQRTLAIRLKLLGEEHEKVADAYSNIGVVYQQFCQYDKALEYGQKALAIRLKLLGEEHTDVAASYNNIGIVYKELAQYDKALEYFHKSAAIRVKVLGEEHMDVALPYSNIGNVYKELAQYDKALEYIQKAMTICVNVLGESHPYIAIYHNMNAYCYAHLKQYDKALESVHKALTLANKLKYQDNKGDILYMSGDYEAAYQVWLYIHEQDPNYPQHTWAVEAEKYVNKR